MKEIKFRVYCNNEMLYQKDIVKGSLLSNIRLFDEIKEQLGFKIMQFTGLKDKNGVEIFEGDIVRIMGGTSYEETFEIKFEKGCFKCFQNINTFQTLEIIGNIYENSDLLDNNKEGN